MTDKTPALPEPVARYDASMIMWLIDGNALVPSPHGRYVLYFDHVAQLSEALDRADRAEKLAEENFAIAVRNGKDAREWRDRATTAEAALEGARKVIEPFSEAEIPTSWRDKFALEDHLRAARQWLSANQKPQPPKGHDSE